MLTLVSVVVSKGKRLRTTVDFGAEDFFGEEVPQGGVVLFYWGCCYRRRGRVAKKAEVIEEVLQVIGVPLRQQFGLWLIEQVLRVRGQLGLVRDLIVLSRSWLCCSRSSSISSSTWRFEGYSFEVWRIKYCFEGFGED